MKKIAYLVLLSLIVAQTAHSQFTQTVKDSVVKLLNYPTASYDISFSFKPEDYLAPSGNSVLQKLNRQELINKKKGDYTDASIYHALFVKSWFEDKNQQEAEQFLTQAGQMYQEWINAEPALLTPVDELLAMCMISQNLQMMGSVLDYALPLFPGNISLINKAVHYEQYFTKNYEKSQQLINQALAIDSFNLITLAYQSGLQFMYQLEAMQQKKPLPIAEMPGLQTATMVSQPGNTGLRHLFHFHQVFNIYMKVIAYAMDVDTNSVKLFDFYTLTPTEKEQLDGSEKWMQVQLAQKGKNEVQILNSLGVIRCIKKDYSGAAGYFFKAYQITRDAKEMDARIICHMFMDDYTQVEKLLEDKIAMSSNVHDYGSLLKVYNRYTLKPDAELALLKKLQAMESNEPVKHQILATGYLKTAQLSLLTGPLGLLGETNTDDLMIKLVAATVYDKKSNAAVYLNKLLNVQPDHTEGLIIKKLAGL
jgi:hypothetical protein